LIQNVQSHLRVDERGTISGTVVNDGEQAVSEAVVRLNTGRSSTQAINNEVRLGDLESGESAPFSFSVQVGPNATASTQVFGFVVRYRTPADTAQQSDTIDRSVRIRPERDWFNVRSRTANFTVDSDNRMVVEVTNNASDPLRDVRAELASSEPLDSESRAAYVGRLEPGESTTVAFQVTVSDEAVPATVPARVTLSGERVDESTAIRERHDVAVSIVEAGGPGESTIFGLGVALVLVALVATLLWLRRA
jgi:hypothetical protein